MAFGAHPQGHTSCLRGLWLDRLGNISPHTTENPSIPRITIVKLKRDRRLIMKKTWMGIFIFTFVSCGFAYDWEVVRRPLEDWHTAALSSPDTLWLAGHKSVTRFDGEYFCYYPSGDYYSPRIFSFRDGTVWKIEGHDYSSLAPGESDFKPLNYGVYDENLSTLAPGHDDTLWLSESYWYGSEHHVYEHTWLRRLDVNGRILNQFRIEEEIRFKDLAADESGEVRLITECDVYHFLEPEDSGQACGEMIGIEYSKESGWWLCTTYQLLHLEEEGWAAVYSLSGETFTDLIVPDTGLPLLVLADSGYFTLYEYRDEALNPLHSRQWGAINLDRGYEDTILITWPDLSITALNTSSSDWNTVLEPVITSRWNAVSATAKNDVWTVGNDRLIRHWNGEEWEYHHASRDYHLIRSDSEGHVWMAGKGGYLFSRWYNDSFHYEEYDDYGTGWDVDDLCIMNDGGVIGAAGGLIFRMYSNPWYDTYRTETVTLDTVEYAFAATPDGVRGLVSPRRHGFTNNKCSMDMKYFDGYVWMDLPVPVAPNFLLPRNCIGMDALDDNRSVVAAWSDDDMMFRDQPETELWKWDIIQGWSHLFTLYPEQVHTRMRAGEGLIWLFSENNICDIYTPQGVFLDTWVPPFEMAMTDFGISSDGYAWMVGENGATLTAPIPRFQPGLNDSEYSSGETLNLNLELINPGPEIPVTIYLAFSIGSNYWFFNEYGSFSTEPAGFEILFPESTTVRGEFLTLTLPDLELHAAFHSLMITEEGAVLDYGRVDFSVGG